MKNKTEDLLNRLIKIRKRSDLKTYIESNTYEKDNIDFHDYILKVCRDKGYRKSDIIRNADINRTYGYQILSGFKMPSRDKVLQICMGNRFTRGEANRALSLSNWGILYAKNPRDSIIIYCLNNCLSLIEANIILHEHGYESLGGSY